MNTCSSPDCSFLQWQNKHVSYICWIILTIIFRSWDIFPSFFFLSTLLKNILCIISHIHLRCTNWWSMTVIYTRDAITIIKIEHLSITPKKFLVLLFSPCFPSSPGSWYWSAFRHSRFGCILDKWNHVVRSLSPSPFSIMPPTELRA